MGMDRGGAVDWVLSSRGRGFAGAWANLGFFTRPGHRLLGADQVTTELPKATQHAAASLFALTPSLTALVVQFVLTGAFGEDLERALNHDYRTVIRRSARGIVYDGPDQQRRRNVEASLERGRRECAEWISDRLPGWFAARPLRDLPTCLFLTTEAARPFDPEVRRHWNSYFGALGLDADHEAWDVAAFPGISLRVTERETSARHWLVAGQKGGFLNDDMQQPYGGATREGWSNRMWHEISDLASVHGALALLRDFHSVAATARDAVSGATLDSVGDRRDLGKLAPVVSAISSDLEPVAAELAVEGDVRRLVMDLQSIVPGPGNAFRFVNRVEDPLTTRPRSLVSRIAARVKLARSSSKSPAAPVIQRPVPTLAQIVGEEIQLSADKLLQGAERTRTALATTATLSSAIETLRLDRRLFRLSLILGVIAVLAALPTLAQIVGVVLRAIGIDPPDLGPTPTPSP
jgi:hypothetical protein